MNEWHDKRAFSRMSVSGDCASAHKSFYFYKTHIVLRKTSYSFDAEFLAPGKSAITVFVRQHTVSLNQYCIILVLPVVLFIHLGVYGSSCTVLEISHS